MILLVCLLSGAAALLLETVWFRAAGLVVGSSITASSIVTGAFMTGLGLGNLIALRRAPRIDRPARAYAAVEALIGLLGLTVAWTLSILGPGLAAFFGDFSDPSVVNIVRFVSMFALMAGPSTLMGVTLPLLASTSAFPPGASFVGVAGTLYGWNTLGAVLGALAGEGFLIEVLGLRNTAVAATVLSFLAAGLALRLREGRIDQSGPATGGSRAFPPVRPWAPLLVAFLCGATLLGLEIAWFRFLLLFNGGTSAVFAVMLATVLMSLALGSLVTARLARVAAAPEAWVAPLAAVGSILSAVCYWAFDPRTAATGELTRAFLMSARLMAPTCVVSGALFALLGAAVRRTAAHHGSALGALTVANTLGAALGPIAAAFILIPSVGIETSIFLASVIYGVAAALSLGLASSRSARWATALAGVLSLGCLAFFPVGLMRQRFHPWSLAASGARGLKIESYREGIETTATYLRSDYGSEPWYYRLVTNSHAMSSSNFPARRYMKLFAYLPAWLEADIKEALLICYGVGNTAQGLTILPGIRAIDVVDLSPEILAMAGVPTAPAPSPLNDPRVTTHIEDGRFFLQSTSRTWDLITGEPPPPRNAGVVNLYSREFFQLVRKRLNDGGKTSYWLPVHQLTPRDTQGIVAAFCDVFADCSLWLGSGNDWILIGSKGIGRPRNTPSLSDDPRLREDLESLGLPGDRALASAFVGGPDFLRQFAGDVPPIEDNWPRRLSTGLTGFNQPVYDQMVQPEARYQRYLRAQASMPARASAATREDFERDSLGRSFQFEHSDEFFARQLIGLRGDPEHRVLSLLAVGLDPRSAEIASRARERGAGEPGTLAAAGVRALAEGRPAEAVRLLRQEKTELPRRFQAALVASLCLSGSIVDADREGVSLGAADICTSALSRGAISDTTAMPKT